jgi:hypothetical protein
MTLIALGATLAAGAATAPEPKGYDDLQTRCEIVFAIGRGALGWTKTKPSADRLADDAYQDCAWRAAALAPPPRQALGQIRFRITNAAPDEARVAVEMLDDHDRRTRSLFCKLDRTAGRWRLGPPCVDGSFFTLPPF